MSTVSHRPVLGSSGSDVSSLRSRFGGFDDGISDVPTMRGWPLRRHGWKFVVSAMRSGPILRARRCNVLELSHWPIQRSRSGVVHRLRSRFIRVADREHVVSAVPGRPILRSRRSDVH